MHLTLKTHHATPNKILGGKLTVITLHDDDDDDDDDAVFHVYQHYTSI